MSGELIEEEGVVTKILGNGRIQVTVKRSEACDTCHSKKNCMALIESGQILVEAHDEVNAEVGQRVVLSQDSAVILKASFLVYLLPVAGLLCGVFVGRILSGLLGMNPELLMPLAGLLGAGSVYYLISRKSFGPSYIPTATRVVSPA